jgi:hypothetical protein
MKNESQPNSGLILYQTEDGRTRIQCRFENETVWLTQAQMAELFQTTIPNISMHIRNVFAEGELERGATDKESLTVEQPEQPADDHIGEVTEMVTEPKHIPINNEAMEQKIVYLYPNKRWVRTDVEDMVFVGMKGVNFRQGQRIWVKNKTLCIR